MNRREFIGVTSTASLGLITGGCAVNTDRRPGLATDKAGGELKLLPYPQIVIPAMGSLRLGPPGFAASIKPSPTKKVAAESLNRHLPKNGKFIPVQLGSLEEGYDTSWLTVEESEFLASDKTAPEASVITITPSGLTVVGKGKWGMLYGVQTICQMAIEAGRQKERAIPCLTIRDWPDMKWRCLAPTLTWYSGWNRLEGYDLCNWTEAEWKWLADWSLLHKCNAWAVCMYGYWPFTLPGYEKETLDVDSYAFNPHTNKKEPRRFTHRNIRQEFYPEVIRYANERGIQVHAYIGKNSFNGCDFKNNAAIYAGGAAEMLPFAPGVDEYWTAFIGRILESGFNGFVFEDPEANHVPIQNQQCYETFWKPWAATYGFSSVKETDQNNPPLGVHIEYYSWLYKRFSEKIKHHAQRLGRQTETYLISHVLLARIMSESKSPEERRHWIELFDEKQGEKVPFIITESNESSYVELLGGDRVASLGGRGGSCTNAMRRISSVNNNWVAGGMGGDLAYERECQKRMVEAGGFGAMGYIFEWTNTEVFAYLAAQHLWRNSGVPGVSNSDQVGILDYAYRLYYGAEVGRLVARAMDEGSDVNDAMVLEGVYGSQYPTTGKALHRDYQLLSVMADDAEKLAREAFYLYAGHNPDLYQPAYHQDDFAWNGYEANADKRFKTERLRWLWLSTRRSQEMCRTALAHRLAQRLMAEGASTGAVLMELDRAIEAAKTNQRIYQVNYDDDYDWTDGLCYKVTERLEEMRKQFMGGCSAIAPDQPVPEVLRKKAEAPVLFIPWEKLTEVLPPKGAARNRGPALAFDIGCIDRDDYYRLGVAFTIQMAAADGTWETVFRRIHNRRGRGWEHWEVPLSAITANKGKRVRLRFMTDSYSRAQERSAPTWKWALWGQPRLIDRTPGGAAKMLYDFVAEISKAHAFVRLDVDGKDRPFDSQLEDSTGATFKPAAPDAAVLPIVNLQKGRGKNWQWLDGFGAWTGTAPSAGDYGCYLGSCDSRWAYAAGGEVTWLTRSAAKKMETAVMFVGSTDFVPSEAELSIENMPLISFETGLTRDASWKVGEVELHYFHRAVIPRIGISGVYVLHVPISLVTAGAPLKLSMRISKKPGGWVMCHGYRDTIQRVINPLPLPGPAMPAIAAFTPHLQNQFGVTVADYEIDLEG